MGALTDPGASTDTAGVGGLSLAASDISVNFGGLKALSGVTIGVAPRSIVGLVGPNGAGKSTLLAVLSGLLRPDRGRVWLLGQDVTNASIRSRAARGLARTFQQPELFMGLTVREHLVLAHRARVAPRRLWRDMFDPRSLLPPSKAEDERVDGLLELLRLTGVAKAPVAALPLGVIRLVEVGRALASDPHVLLLDEPLSGLDLQGIGESAGGIPSDRGAAASTISRWSSWNTTSPQSWPSRIWWSSSISGNGSPSGIPRRSAMIRPCGPRTWGTPSRLDVRQPMPARALNPPRRGRDTERDRAPPQHPGRRRPLRDVTGVVRRVHRRCPRYGSGRAGTERGR